MREIADILAERGTLPSAEILPELQTLTVRGVALHGWQSGGSDGVPCETTSGIEFDGCRAANVPEPAVVVTAYRSGSSYGADIRAGRAEDPQGVIRNPGGRPWHWLATSTATAAVIQISVCSERISASSTSVSR